jgi:hypothetical protein
MSFFTAMVVIGLLSFAAVAVSGRVVLVSAASVLATAVAIVASMGGPGKTGESQAMTIGFGLMFLIPMSGVTVLAVALGHAARRKLVKHDFKPFEALGPSQVAVSNDDAIAIALLQVRRGSVIKIKCPSCRGRLKVQRVLSTSGKVPDIALTCPCGACSGVHRFQADEGEGRS